MLLNTFAFALRPAGAHLCPAVGLATWAAGFEGHCDQLPCGYRQFGAAAAEAAE